ncbi:ErfK/YbiS/YcfS/YnhG family protein [hydrothermal vent metagenome]|uniref:ErfK/YbiS/YcfS/YnhG family protein n=1 Tax=hydrothermal vent metagenome TaxID=652676 RepID=A0A1W1BI88_9ZZZZ
MKTTYLLSLLLLLSACTPQYLPVNKKIPYNTKPCKKALKKHSELRGMPIDYIVVYKKQKKLKTFTKGKHRDTFRISLGKNANKGHKVKQGDYRTPEGSYTIIRKKCDKRLYKSLLISYPNQKDRDNARKKGFDAGGYITIHGQPKWNADGRGDDHTLKSNWTEGCIAVSNSSMDNLWHGVSNGAKITIYP